MRSRHCKDSSFARYKVSESRGKNRKIPRDKQRLQTRALSHRERLRDKVDDDLDAVFFAHEAFCGSRYLDMTQHDVDMDS